MTAFLKGVKGQRGVWASGGTQRRPAGGEGRHLGRKGKCRSTQSKPYHMLQSAGISPLAPTGKLCKRLLIWESACRKTERWLELRHLAGLSLAMPFMWCHSMDRRQTRSVLEVLTDWQELIQWERNWHKIKQKIWLMLIWCEKASPGTSIPTKRKRLRVACQL